MSGCIQIMSRSYRNFYAYDVLRKKCETKALYLKELKV